VTGAAGVLAYKSGLFAQWLIVVGGVCCLVDLLAAFLLPALAQKIHAFIIIPSAIAEISMVLYLLVVGGRRGSRAGALLLSVAGST
jgi:hypothetical protein